MKTMDRVEVIEIGLTEKQLENRIKKLAALEESKKALEAQIEAIKNEVKAEMAGAEELQTKHFLIRNTKVSTARFDSKAFKAAMPELYSEYTKTSESTRFSFKAIA